MQPFFIHFCKMIIFMMGILYPTYKLSQQTKAEMVFKTIKKIVRQLDRFPHQQFLNYRGKQAYKTTTGGIISIIAIFLIIFLASSQFLTVIRKRKVNATKTQGRNFDPPLTVIPLSPEGGFMVAVKILQVNHTQSLRIFDINLYEETYGFSGATEKAKLVPLSLCTAAHFDFAGVNKLIQNYNLTQWLRPPLGYQMHLEGKSFSAHPQRMRISVSRCNVTDLGCISDKDAQNIEGLNQGYFRFATNIITPMVNPQNPDRYVTHFIEDSNWFKFSLSFSAMGTINVADYSITTDESLVPIPSQKVEKGVYVPGIMRYEATPLSKELATFLIQKSEIFTQYNRKYTTFDQFLAYAGGLIGSFLGFIFITKLYNQFCFHLAVSNDLCVYKRGYSIPYDSFNLFTYIKYLLFKFVNLCGFYKNDVLKKYDKVVEQTEKQLDVLLLFKRIAYLEKCIQLLIPKNQLDLLYLSRKPTIKEMAQKRKRFRLPQRITKRIKHKIVKLNSVVNYFCDSQTGDSTTSKNQAIKQVDFDDNDSISSCSSIEQEQWNSMRSSVHNLRQQSKEKKQVSTRILEGMKKDYCWALEDAQNQENVNRSQMERTWNYISFQNRYVYQQEPPIARKMHSHFQGKIVDENNERLG